MSDSNFEHVYAVREDEQGNTVYMQDQIMEGVLGYPIPADMAVGFRNGNTLDCRRANLFLVKRGTLEAVLARAA